MRKYQDGIFQATIHTFGQIYRSIHHISAEISDFLQKKMKLHLQLVNSPQ